MDDSNDYDYQASNPNETSSTIHGSPSEDESFNDNNDEDFILFHEIHDEDDDDDDEFVSSSDAELEPSSCDPLIEKSDADSFKIEFDETKNESINSADCDQAKLSIHHQRNKRSSGRLRKEGKVSMHAKNLFPGRPRIRMRKFTLNMNLNISENTDKSTPSSSEIHEPLDTSENQSEKIVSDVHHHQSPSQSILDDPNELTGNNDPTTATIPDDIEIVENVAETRNVSKISVAKKKMNYSGKSRGKLAGRRNNKAMEYRKKRGPKNKFKNFVSVSQAFPPTSEQTLNSSVTSDNEKQQDDSNENKIILCSSNDSFVLSQDVCVMCGSLGKDGEGRLLSCAQCGQCCHPFCAGIKLTKIMLKKGWRCLECTVCEICGKPTDEGRLLLCDDCDISYHTYCLDPPLEEVPQGTWKCQWCVQCVKCNNTTPGYGSHWQENYTCCGPCASQEKCSVCKLSYDENDLIIQCNQCSRWLHSKCDSMFDENECEIASSVGYNCLNCRPKNEPPPHIQARKNGTLRSIFNKKRAEERNDPVLMKKTNETVATNIKDGGCSLENGQPSDLIGNNENAVNSKLLSKYLVDGVYLSEAGLAMIKSQTLEPPKKQRVKRKNVKEESLDESFSSNNQKEFDENGGVVVVAAAAAAAEENGPDMANNKQQSEEEKKKRLRRLRLDKLGIGGFLIKQRGRLSFNREDDEIGQDFQQERSTTPDNGGGGGNDTTNSKPRRRRRSNKKKNQLQDQYPAYLREAFFGETLLDVATATANDINGGRTAAKLESDDDGSGKEEEEEEEEQKTIGMDKIIDLKMELVQSLKPKSNNNDELNFLVDNLTTDVLNVFSPDNFFLNMIINEDAPNDDEVLNELDVENDDGGGGGGGQKNGAEQSNGGDNNDDDDDDDDVVAAGKMAMEEIFNLNEYNDTDSGLPQMDSKDVEDLFEVMSSSSSISIAAPPPLPPPPPQPPQQPQPPVVQQPPQIMAKEYHHHQQQQQHQPSQNLVMVPPQKPNVEPLNLPLMVAKHSSEMSDPSSTPTSVTPLSGDPCLSGLQQQYSPFNSAPPQQNPYKIASKPQQQQQQQQQEQVGNPSDYYMTPTPEQDSEGTTQLQKNLIKCESEEALGQFATISAVLYSNINHPELRQEYPVFADRFKQIHKIWRQLSSDQRAPYLQMARDNRSQSKKNQAEMSQKNLNKNNNNNNNKMDGGDKPQWKDVVPNGANLLHNAPPMSSQSGEHGGVGGGGGFPPMSSEYTTHGPPNQNRYTPTPMGIPQHAASPMAQLSPNPMMMQPSQPSMAHSPHHSMSPAAAAALHSPRLRPYVDNNNYAQPPPLSPAMQQHGQMNMIRPSTMGVLPTQQQQQQQQQGSFSPNSPSLNPVHPANADWNQSSPGTPQRSQSADIHSYGGGGGGPPPPTTPSPYGPTGPVCQKSFSPNQHHHQLSAGTITNDPYHSANMETSSSLYKSKMNQIPKSHTPDTATSSYIPSMAGGGGGGGGTPQPSQSPQSQVPQSPLNEMYARSSPSSAPTRSIPPTSQAMVRQTSFDDNVGGGGVGGGYNTVRQPPSELYSPNTATTGTGSGYSPQFMQQNTVQSYNIPSDGSIRPNMVNNVPNRPNLPIRRAISDPYARQPLSNSGGGGVGSVGGGVEDPQQDQHSKQHLRNLLQVQQIRRHDSPTNQTTSGANNPQMWPDNANNNNNNNNNFRHPISPALTNRIRVPMQPQQQGFPMEPGFRGFAPGQDQQQQQQQQHRMMMHRNPQNSGDMRFRQMVGPQQQQQQQQQQSGPFEVRFQHQSPMNPQRMLVKQQQQQGPVTRLQGPMPHQQQQQPPPNWPQQNVTGATNVNLHPNQMMVQQQNMVFQQQQQSTNNINNNNKMTQPAHKPEMSNETIKMPMANDMIQPEDVEEPLPVELGDDDELLQLANDFNILEYADPELDSKTVIGGHSGKSNIFDEIETEMLSEKEKDTVDPETKNKSNADGSKTELVGTNVNKAGNGNEQQLYQQMNYVGANPNDPNRMYNNLQPTKTTVGSNEVDPNSVATLKHDQQDQYFQNITNPDCFMSDDDFERLKNDCLNDSDQINSGGGGGEMSSPNQMNSYSMAPVQQQQSGPHIPPPSPGGGGGLISPQPPPPPPPQQQQPSQSTPPHQSHQIYMQNCQYNPTTSMNAGQHQQGGPAWGTTTNRMNFPNRMNPRMAMNQQPNQVMNARHMAPGSMYHPQPVGSGNRMVMQQQQASGHLPMNTGPNQAMMSRPTSAMMAEQNMGPNDPYDIQQQQNANLLLQKQKHFESEVGKLRKIKKSLNAKQRQCKKNQNELSEQDKNELARITQETMNMQKQLDQVRKLVRQNRVLQDRSKQGQAINLPHSPSTQTSPRSVNSPLAVLNTSGPGTPLGICPSTPQSPSLTCPSPSSLIQNSPKSSLHSPAPMMPPSPMTNNNPEMQGVRPQIVQEDNNPFSDVYLQNEKKQTMQQPNMYAGHPPMTKEIVDPRQQQQQSMYGNSFDEMTGMQPVSGPPPPPPPPPPPQQYYHGQPMQQQYQNMANMRPTQTSMNFPDNNYRFPNPHFVGPQQQQQQQQQPPPPPQMNYQQQMRRPPPPPYPKTPQNFGARGPPYPLPQSSSANPAQVRVQPQMRNPLDCNMNPGQMQSHAIYPDPNDPGFPLTTMDPTMPIVGEAETTMEFNISEPGNGVDNESDPFTFLKEMANQQANPPIPSADQNQSNGSNNNFITTTTTNDNSPSVANNNGQQSTSTMIEDHHQDRSLNHAAPSNANCEPIISSSFPVDVQNVSNSEDHPDLSVSNVAKLKNGGQNEPTNRPAQDGGSDNSEDDVAKMENPNVKPNALLKKLLQNCPSADLKSLNNDNQGQQSSSSAVDVANSSNDEQQNIETEASTLIDDETNHRTAVAENITVNNTDQEQTLMLSGMNETGNNNGNDDDEHGTNIAFISEPSSVTKTTATTTTTTTTATAATTTTNSSSSNNHLETPPVVEKKLSYLDIRRAQLEKEPTPPLEDIKPKRKRKRKESNKSLDGGSGGGAGGDSMDSNHHMNNTTGTNVIKTKKRTRKGSQTKVEHHQDASNSSMDTIGGGGGGGGGNNNNHEKMLSQIIKHIGTLPSIQIVEPEVKINLNVCLPPDATDFNTRKPKLKGCYGRAFLSSAIDYYSTFPFGPNKPAANHVVAATTNGGPNSGGNKVGYYNDEFGRSILDWKEPTKERRLMMKSSSSSSSARAAANSLYCRDVDSPETIVSASSPECDLYDEPKDEYNKMKFINDDDDGNVKSEDEDRKSPFFTFLPLHRPVPLYASPKDMTENNKENCAGTNHRSNHKSFFRSNNHAGNPLKETGNVGITIMINPGRDVRTVMECLAKLLNLRSSFTYNIAKSPSDSQITEVFEIFQQQDNGDNVYCKSCNAMIKDQGYKALDNGRLDISLDDDDCFCNKECFKNYCLTTVNASMKKEYLDDDDDHDDDDDSGGEMFGDDGLLDENELETNDLVEDEIASIFDNNNHNNDNKNDQCSEDLDSIISIHEKHWKNTKYLYWNVNAFKSEQKVQTAEEEPVEALLDRLDICLKANRNCQERRRCLFCHDLGDGEKNGPSRLLNMDVGKWVHLNCALWSNEVYEICNGALMNVDLAYNRAINSGCVSCLKFGASIKCFKLRCNNSYHFPCAIREKCAFYTDKTLLCPLHCSKGPLLNAKEMSSFVVDRKVYINRDEQKQIAAMLHQGEQNLMRIGSLIFLNIGQLLPHQLQNFHTNSYIYPIGYKVSRFYWSSRKLGKRCQYVCSIDELDGRPQFRIEVKEDGYENVTYQAATPKLAWEKIIESIVRLREESKTIKVFFDFISGEDLFGLNEPAIIRILESLPGVDTLYDYNFKYGRSPWYELPLAINPSGCARSEPKKRFHSKRPHTLHVSSNTTRSSLQSPLTNQSESSSPYVKQFVHSKVSQYRKMKQEWRNNVYLGRSRIQGLGLYASRDIEKHTMIIEYIGSVIRNAIADRNERIHEAHNRGIYMFRLDDNRVIDATLTGGLARYVNHSCDPNCVAESVQIDRENKILIIANRRIQKGEELTYDYKFDVEDDQHKIPCLCGAKNCRKWMN